MTSYRNEVGAWDGGPPGAEGDYAPLPAAPPPAPMPTTDPWTGVSYTQYPSNYDYQSYGVPQYGYSYDSSYYQRADSYYDSPTTYSGQYQSSYGYTKPLDQPSDESRKYLHRRSSFKSKSRSGSPYDRRDREYSMKEYNYDRHKSKTRSLSKRKYTPSRSSSRSKSRSFSRSPVQRKRCSASSGSDISKNSYQNSHRSDRSLTPSDKMRKSKSFHGSSSASSERRSRSISPRYRIKKEKWDTITYKTERSRSSSSGTKLEKSGYRCKSPKVKEERDSSVSRFSKDKKVQDKQGRNLIPPRNMKSPLSHVKLEKRSVTPSKRRKAYDDKSTTPPKRSKYKDRHTLISDRPRDSSVTPPRCYARSPSSSKSRSSRSLTPKERLSIKSRRRSSSSSSDSYARKASRSRSEKRSKRKSISREKCSSRSPSRERHKKSRSKSRHRSRVHRSRSIPRKSKSRSRSTHSSSRSGTKTPSDDERRGQFTVADRKRYWKLHRHIQGRAKSPKEIKPPPGAIETTKVDDIDYGDPPEVEGPNFAELLSSPSLTAVEGPSNSRINKTPLPIPIKNDGSFLEMFKKLQEETKKQEEVKKPEIKKPVLPFIGKRRGGRVLKTGLVKKAKAIDEQTVDNTPKDAWSLYMQEVKKYRETSCEEERKTRPLVK